MGNVANLQRLNLHFKNRKLSIILWGLMTIILLLLIYSILCQGQSKITITEKDIEYILLDGFDVQIGNKLLSGEINKRLDGESAKKTIVDYINNLDNLNYYRQGDPIIGTPSFQIRIFLHDEGTITLEEGGIIVQRKNNSEQWYCSADSFQALFYELYME